MKLRHLLVASAVVAAGASGVAGIASAAAPHTSGTQHILLLQTNPNGSPVVIARGPIHAQGKDIVVNDSRDRFVFPKGALIVRHHATRHHDSFDKVTCYGRHTESGTYTVLGGTKAYQHASGHGTYHLTVQFVGCSQSNPPRVFQLQVNADGPINF
jgi:hypothetical protein